MAKMYYAKDCDINYLNGKKIAIIGYGSQGHAHALNLKDSGCDVCVGLRAGSKNWSVAEKDGLKVMTVPEAAKWGDIVMMLINDEVQADVYKSEIAPHMTEGKALAFAHGFNIRYQQIVPPAGVDVFMAAPKGPGHTVRSQYVNGKTMPRSEILQFLADALQVDADWLAGRTGSAQNFSSEKLNSGSTKLPTEFNFCPHPDTVNGSSAAGSVQSSAFSKRSDSVQKKTSSRQDGSDFSAPSASQPTLFKKSSKLNNVLYDVRGPVVDEAAKMEERGTHVLKLNIGNPAPFGFRTPDEIIYDMSHQLSDCEGYSASQGLFSARKAIMQYAQLKKLPNVTIDDIYTGNGVSELINLSMSALLDDGDEILIPSPDYPLWTACATLAGGKAVHYLCDEQSNWYPDISDMKKKINDRTKALVIINPNNPTGALYPKEVLQQIVDLAREHHLIIFSDEIYDRLVMDGQEHISIASLAPDLFCVTFSGLSKSHMIAGFRIGWMILSGNKSIAADYIEGLKMLSNMRLCSNVPAQSIVQTALGGHQSVESYIVPGGRIYEQREYIYNALTDIPGISAVKPQAAFYMFPKIDTKKFDIVNDEKFALDLLRDKKLLIVHGGGFNWKEPDHFRVVYLPRIEILKEAVEKIGDFLSYYRQ